MLYAVVRKSLDFPRLVLLLSALLVVYGAFLLTQAEFEVFPEFVPAQASVQAEAPGLTAGQVELLVTRPLEDAINGATGVAAVRSRSIQGLAVVDVTFRDGEDPYRARQVVAERLSEVSSRLPAGVGAPSISPLTSSTMDLLKIGLVSDTLTPMQLRDLGTMDRAAAVVVHAGRGAREYLRRRIAPHRGASPRGRASRAQHCAPRCDRGDSRGHGDSRRRLRRQRDAADSHRAARRRDLGGRLGQRGRRPRPGRSDHARASRRRGRCADAEIRRCVGHGPARGATDAVEPIRCEYAYGDARRGGRAERAQARARRAGGDALPGAAPSRQLHRDGAGRNSRRFDSRRHSDHRRAARFHARLAGCLRRVRLDPAVSAGGHGRVRRCCTRRSTR